MEKQYFRLFFILIFLAYLSLAFRTNDSVADIPLSEDGYYSLTIAKNISEGNGITYNGQDLTNGFQPLFTFICVPIFLISGNELYLALRLLIILSLLIFALSALIFGRNLENTLKIESAGNSAVNEIASFAYFSSLFLYSLYFNGLETGFLLLMLIIVWHLYISLDFNRIRNILLLGFVLGLLVLTRIDAAFFVFIFILFFSLQRERKKVLSFFLLGIISLVVSSPWWLYNFQYFGSFMPSSGTAQQQIWFFAAWRTIPLMTALLSNLLPHAFTFDKFIYGLNEVAVKAIILFILLFIINNYSKRKFFKFGIKDNSFLLALIICTGVLSFWYYFTSWAVFFYPRYLSILSLIGVGLITLLLATWNSHKKVFSISLSILLLVMNIALIGVIHFRTGFSGSTFYNEQRVLIQRCVPDKETVAAAQTGTLGYFRKHVINLDGKVNAEAIPFRYKGREYLRKKHIKWFCDWKLGVDRYLGNNPAQYGWMTVDSTMHFKLLKFEGSR